MHRTRIPTMLAAVLAAILLAVASFPSAAHARTVDLKSGSQMHALGQTFTLSADCVGFLNSGEADPTCGTFTGATNVTVRAHATLNGTANTVGSTIQVAGPFTVHLSSILGSCDL